MDFFLRAGLLKFLFSEKSITIYSAMNQDQFSRLLPSQQEELIASVEQKLVAQFADRLTVADITTNPIILSIDEGAKASIRIHLGDKPR